MLKLFLFDHVLQQLLCLLIRLKLRVELKILAQLIEQGQMPLTSSIIKNQEGKSYIIQIMKQIVITTILLALLSLASSQAPARSYNCNTTITGCKQCSFTGFCGVCTAGFSLMINSTTSVPYCQQIPCPNTNCTYCSAPYICGSCQSGTFLNAQGQCQVGTAPVVTCLANCQVCNSTNSTQCLLCGVGFNLQNGYCFPNFGSNVSNCLSYFSPIACQQCANNYYVSPSYQCVPMPSFSCTAATVTNCVYCVLSAGNTVCGQCIQGYTVDANGTCVTATCNINNCQTCTNSSACGTCYSPYVLSSTFTCVAPVYACGINNCLFCSAANVCSKCQAGFTVSVITQGGVVVGSSCVQSTNPSNTLITNCVQYGPLVPGTAQLTYGCVQCQTNFIQVLGYCVANISQQNYQCNINNCLYCIQNNVCGACKSGSLALIGSLFQCTTNYSPIPNCAITTYLTTTLSCYQCNAGYQLISGFCYNFNNSNVNSCNSTGCNYCANSNDNCTVCLPGYTPSNGNCNPTCNVTNCYQCSTTSMSLCTACDAGYFFNSTSATCQSASNMAVSYCNTNFGINCTACSYYQCQTCASGFTLVYPGLTNPVSNACCPNPVLNIANCAQTVVTWKASCAYTLTCAVCNVGSFLTVTLNGLVQCTTIPCSIQNCAYCFNSENCIVCAAGYQLTSGTCQPYTTNCTSPVSNCAFCSSSNTCVQCLTGYVVYSGVCVPNRQNCLTTQGNQFCVQSAYPPYGNSNVVPCPGCFPVSANFYQCNVPNCVNCLNATTCQQCDVGFSVQPNGNCTINTCNRNSNCALCSVNSNICYACKAGFIQSNIYGSSCVPLQANYSCLVAGCAVCNSSTTCQTCSPFHANVKGVCDPINCPANCAYCLQSNTCLFCNAGFYFTTSNTCQQYNNNFVACPNTLKGCTACQMSGSNTICVECIIGQQPATNGQSCVPAKCSTPNCFYCPQALKPYNGAPLCLICKQGYFINSYYQCVSYTPALAAPSCSSIYNCIYCIADNYCSLCAPGWYLLNGTCITNQTAFCPTNGNCGFCYNLSQCYNCTTNYLLTSTNTCTPNCNIANCSSCATLTTCGTCAPGFVLGANSTSCNCPQNSQLVNGTCVCDSGYISNGGVCYQCASPCSSCSANNVCTACIAGNYTLSSSQCYQCNIPNCATCNANNTCLKCINNFTANGTSTCSCEAPFTQVNSTCSCGANFTFDSTNNTCVQCNIANCASCSSTNVCGNCAGNLNLVNNTCQCPANLVLYNSYCYTCAVPNCSVCSSNNVCYTCLSTFVLNPTNNSCTCPSGSIFYTAATGCVNCNVAGCSSCSSSNYCVACSAGYSLYQTQGTNSQSTCLICSILSCTTCSSPNFCTTCANGLVPNSQGNLCVTASNVPGCASLLNSNACSICSSGFQLSTTSTCVTCNIANCAVCSSNNVCASCQQGFSLSGTSCQLCVFPCATCNGNSANSCLTCLAPFSSNAASNGTCYTCSVPNCMTCNVGNTTQCTACSTGYTVSSTGTCTLSSGCSATCAVCINQVCSQCLPGYTVSASNTAVCSQCSANATNCITCSSTDLSTCVVCAQGFYVNQGVCTACPFANCLQCTATACTSYKTSTGQFAVSFAGVTTPAICDPGCATCANNNPMVCITCMTGYSLNTNNLCVACTYPCMTCNLASSPSTCTSCYANAVLQTSSNTCTTCTGTNCQTCSASNTSQCTSCMTGFFLNGGSCSGTCPANCLSCSSSSVCTVCQTGYSVSFGGVCLPCTVNCRICSGTQQGICLECGLGFYVSPTTSTCVACSANCATCYNQGCITCQAGYTLTSALTCTPNCVAPCASCSNVNPSSCTSCLLGYTLNNAANTCSPMTSCVPFGCTYCPSGYVPIISSGQCSQCQVNNCARCSATNTSTCVVCNNGYYLNGNTCTACPQGCATCSSPSNCLSCSPLYALQVQGVQGAGACVRCVAPCENCVTNPNTCTSCSPGSSLNGWNCQSNFYFAFSVSLSTTLTTFYDNYQAFLNAILNSFSGKQLYVINVQSIYVGAVSSSNQELINLALTSSNPVVVNGGISTIYSSNSNEASGQFYSVENVFQQGSIAGMTISTFNLTPQNGIIPPESSPNNLAIILGVCIPVGIIIIGALLYFLVIRKKNSTSRPANYDSQATTVRQTFELTKDETTL